MGVRKAAGEFAILMISKAGIGHNRPVDVSTPMTASD